MVKLIILYKQPPNQAEFEARYADNLALLEKMPGIVRRQANMVRGGPAGESPYYRILEFYFESAEALDAAMTSDEGQLAGRKLMQYAADFVELVFTDVFEDNTAL